MQYVPHFKALVNGREALMARVCNTFNVKASLLKFGHLFHKSGHFDSQLLTTVCIRQCYPIKW